MNEDLEQVVWDRIREGRAVAVVGPLPGVRLKAPGDFVAIHVTCDGPWTTWGPLEDARARVEGHLHGDSFLSQARDRVVTGLRRRLLGDVTVPTLDAALVEACNALFDQTEGRAVLVLDHVQVADTATLEALRSLVGRVGWLRMPLVLMFREAPSELAAEVLAVFRASFGDAAVVEAGASAGAAPASLGVGSARSGFEGVDRDPEVLRVMRAASILGEVFEVALLSRLLREEPAAVLYGLQRAWDAGLPLEDRGEGRFAMPMGVCEALASSVLPSLRTFWHEQLATLLSPVPAAEGRYGRRRDAMSGESREAVLAELDGAVGEVEGGGASPSFADLFSPVSAEPVVAEGEGAAEGMSADVAAEDTNHGAPAEPARLGEPLEASSALPDPFMDSGGVGPAGSAAQSFDDLPAEPPRESRPLAWRSASHPSLADRGRRLDSYPEDTARAAVHLEAAGQREAAIARYIDAARQVAAGGDARRAYLLVRQALGLLEQSPVSLAMRRLKGRALTEQGRLQWRGSVLGPPFTLPNALASLDEAKALLVDSLSPEGEAELSKLIAGVCFDLGDEASLKRSLEELTLASRNLLERGQPTEAARLLNDQAAVWIRLGDPVRAVHLLNQSRGLFTELLRNAPDEPVAMVELAETEHLLARLPMHASARAGRQEDAWDMGLDYARAAAERYKRLGLRLELGRVWETMGRLELNRGRLNDAADDLNRALQLQQVLGDVTGLARSAATMSELLLQDGQVERALALLADSVALNFEKGSPAGLGFNRFGLERLARAVEAHEGPVDSRVLQALAQLDAQIKEGIEHGAGRPIARG